MRPAFETGESMAGDEFIEGEVSTILRSAKVGPKTKYLYG